MQSFEKFFKSKLIEMEVPYVRTSIIPNFCDFVIVLNSKTWFIELKERKRFNFKSYSKVQKKQYEALFKFPEQTLFIVKSNNFVFFYNFKGRLLKKLPFSKFSFDLLPNL